MFAHHSVGIVLYNIALIGYVVYVYTGAGSVLSQSLYLILLQRLSDNYSTPDTLYMNRYEQTPVNFKYLTCKETKSRFYFILG